MNVFHRFINECNSDLSQNGPSQCRDSVTNWAYADIPWDGRMITICISACENHWKKYEGSQVFTNLRELTPDEVVVALTLGA